MSDGIEVYERYLKLCAEIAIVKSISMNDLVIAES